LSLPGSTHLRVAASAWQFRSRNWRRKSAAPSRVVARVPQRPRKWAGLAGAVSRFGPSKPSGQRPPQRLPTACVLLK